jgi:hypothetical protein
MIYKINDLQSSLNFSTFVVTCYLCLMMHKRFSMELNIISQRMTDMQNRIDALRGYL